MYDFLLVKFIYGIGQKKLIEKGRKIVLKWKRVIAQKVSLIIFSKFNTKLIWHLAYTWNKNV
jgi:hypothetical protein